MALSPGKSRIPSGAIVLDHGHIEIYICMSHVEMGRDGCSLGRREASGPFHCVEGGQARGCMVALQAGHWAFSAQCVCTPAQSPRDPPPGPRMAKGL